MENGNDVKYVLVVDYKDRCFRQLAEQAEYTGLWVFDYELAHFTLLLWLLTMSHVF